MKHSFALFYSLNSKTENKKSFVVKVAQLGAISFQFRNQ